MGVAAVHTRRSPEEIAHLMAEAKAHANYLAREYARTPGQKLYKRRWLKKKRAEARMKGITIVVE